MLNYLSDWKQSVCSCRHCAWIGTGRDLVLGEMFHDLYELRCPTCHRLVNTIVFPTLKECRQNWHKLPEEGRMAVEYMEARQREFAKRKLREAAQLPDIDGEELVILWDIEYREGGDTILRHGMRVLWKEPSFYEGYNRFVEVGEILLAKYGSRLKDFVPTEQSALYLYGDASLSIERVSGFREKLRRLA